MPDTPVDELELTPRTLGWLQDRGIETLEQLLSTPEIRAGKLVIAEIEALLADRELEYDGELVIERRPVVQAMGDVGQRWAAIAAWLATHAADVLASFLPPATADEITAAERALGTQLPVELRQFYAIHGGQAPGGPMVDTCSLLPVAEIATRRDRLARLLKPDDFDPSETDEAIQSAAWSPGWIPIGCSARGRDYLCVDLEPGPGGAVGQIIELGVDHDERIVVATSFAELLGLFYEQLQADELM